MIIFVLKTSYEFKTFLFYYYFYNLLIINIFPEHILISINLFYFNQKIKTKKESKIFYINF